MKTLAELRQLASESFAKSGLVPMLMAWCRSADQDLASLLQPIDFVEFDKALRPFLEQDNEADSRLLLECIGTTAGEEATGYHLLLTVCAHPEHRVYRALVRIGFDCAALKKAVKPQSTFAGVALTPDTSDQALLRYGRNLSALAKQGAFNELAPRPADIEQLMEILLRKRKGNPILTGAAGVGKTALVELLAHEMVQNPQHPLAERAIYEISMGKLVAGTKYRGEFEGRFEEVMQALQELPTALLFIDEIHLLLGAGRAEGAAMDGANLIKPFLARDQFRVIGATTQQEYHRYIARDEALARRFQEIQLLPPAPELVFAMVHQQADALSAHHGVSIEDTVIRRAIALTEQHQQNRHQPDKSIDLLDSTAVAVRRRGGTVLTADDLLTTLARLTGTPIGTLTQADRTSLAQLSTALQQRVIGQEAAIDRVVTALVHRRLALGNQERPLGVFLFAGDSGVGKTELARAIAASFLGDAKKLITLDLAEYSGQSSLHKLIGAPAGLVGSEQEGVLIQGLQTHSNAVILLDEVEKAAPEVHQVLLGLLDNGRITSARGQRFDARNSVIILTTNAVTADDLAQSSIGFIDNKQAANPADLLAETFPREFLGRLDEIIPFRRLGEEDLREILKLRLKEAEIRLQDKGLKLVYEPTRLLRHLMAQWDWQHSGARGIARLLERALLQPLAMALLTLEAGEEITIELDKHYYDTGHISLSSTQAK